MRLLLPLPRKEKISKKKNLKNCLAEIHTLEVWPIHRNVAGSRFVETLSTDCSLPLFVGHAKGWNGLCLIAKFTKRGHNLFLPKMRMISARQLNHRNDNRSLSDKKNKYFFCCTAHFIYLCTNNKSCLKRQQIKEVRGIWVVTKS